MIELKPKDVGLDTGGQAAAAEGLGDYVATLQTVEISFAECINNNELGIIETEWDY